MSSSNEMHSKVQPSDSSSSAILLLPLPRVARVPSPRAGSPSSDGSSITFDGPTITLPSGDKTTIICEPTVSGDGDNGSTLKCPPVICEQGPSAPSSPTSPGCSRLRRPRPLNASAMERISLLTTGYPTAIDLNKLSPLSPYATSDLGSSPRSSISLATNSLSPCWTGFRDSKKSSLEGDGDSDICCKDLLSPCVYSPAPFSPFSDCTEPPETPLSSYGAGTSPAISPLQSLHFSFDPVRSSSSLSGRVDASHHLLVPESNLDLQTRERSRSDGEMASKGNTEEMDTSAVQSTISIPATSSTPGQYKKRLLQKYEKEQENKKIQKCEANQSVSSVNTQAAAELEEEVEKSVKRIMTRTLSRQLTVDDSSSPSISEFQPKQPLIPPPNEPFESQQQFNVWMQHQLLSWRNHWYRNPSPLPPIRGPPIIGVRTPSPCLLAPPGDHMPRGMARNTISPEMESNFGPIRTATIWRRSRSESDVTSGSYVCQHCGQAFALHDRLAKHIASRHRDRSASVVGEDGPSKAHKCAACSKSFGRSDMLTRHMRLHTGIKPYGCQICGQVFSRSDHLSTHQRTHTGEKPYRCPQCSYAASRRDMITRHMRTHIRPPGSPEFNPLALSQLSLSHSSTQLQHSETILTENIGALRPPGFGPVPPHPLVGSPLMMCAAANAVAAAAAAVASSNADDVVLGNTDSFPSLQNLPVATAAASLIGSNLHPSAFTARGKLAISLSTTVTSSQNSLSSSSSLLTLPTSSSFQPSHSSPSTPTLCRHASIGGVSSSPHPD